MKTKIIQSKKVEFKVMVIYQDINLLMGIVLGYLELKNMICLLIRLLQVLYVKKEEIEL